MRCTRIVAETGGARRSWLRGLTEVTKRYLMQVAGHNLAIIMRTLFGVGKPRALQGLSWALAALLKALRLALIGVRHSAKALYQVIAWSGQFRVQDPQVHATTRYLTTAA